MDIYLKTKTWNNSLGIVCLENKNSIDRLINTFEDMRKKVSILANEISRSLPDFTVHDITHIDSLWEMADIVCGDDYPLNPVEAFVLGGAFLLHDIAMSIQSYPNGIKDLENDSLWEDTIAQRCKSLGRSVPSSFRYVDLDNDIKEYTVGTLLRKLHAKTAEAIVLNSWTSISDGSQVFLINETEIRQTLGRLIGKIAHSHWWDIKKVELEFTRVIGSPSWCPKEWTIDPLKIACILRASDATHIDARRAPSFLRTIRKLNVTSDEHWAFQEKLLKPYSSGDSLYYTSASPFEEKSALSWWLCYDTLKMIDAELRQIDSLLSDKGMPRFQSKRVFAVESPERLSSLIQTLDWSPIDANIHIGDLPKIIKLLGGRELYGNNLAVPIRELIQNSSDAIRARKSNENRPNDWGCINVTVESFDDNYVIEIADNGIGMSLNVIKDYLFDFGTSYWNSDLMQEEYPGLIAKDIKHTGKYGIGFYSIFMLSEKIKIITRKSTAAQEETYTLCFNDGLHKRPIIKKSEPKEYLVDGGTSIQIEIDKEVYAKLTEGLGDKELTIFDIVKSVAIGTDISINVIDKVGNESKTLVSDFWKTSSDIEFYDYLSDYYDKFSYDKFEKELLKEHFLTCVRFIYDEDGSIIGRGSISSPKDASYNRRGVMVVNGLTEDSISPLTGIFEAKNTTAARDYCKFVASEKILSEWANEQANILNCNYDDEYLYGASNNLFVLGSNEVDLIPVAFDRNGYYTLTEFGPKVGGIECLYLMDESESMRLHSSYPDLELINNIFFSKLYELTTLNSYNSRGEISDFIKYEKRNIRNLIYKCIADSWGLDVKSFGRKSEHFASISFAVGICKGVDIKENGYKLNR
ncbi:ATP-binding protein [Vibrio fluvialis]